MAPLLEIAIITFWACFCDKEKFNSYLQKVQGMCKKVSKLTKLDLWTDLAHFEWHCLDRDQPGESNVDVMEVCRHKASYQNKDFESLICHIKRLLKV